MTSFSEWPYENDLLMLFQRALHSRYEMSAPHVAEAHMILRGGGGGEHSGTKWLPTAKGPGGAETVIAKI